MRTHLRNACGTVKICVPYALSRNMFVYPAEFLQNFCEKCRRVRKNAHPPKLVSKCVPIQFMVRAATKPTVLYCIHKHFLRLRINSSTLKRILDLYSLAIRKRIPVGKKLFPRTRWQASETACHDPDQPQR